MVRVPTDIDAEQFVADLYRGILLREPSREEVASYVAVLKTSGKPDVILRQFIDCDEGKMRRSSINSWQPNGHYYSPVVNPNELRPSFSIPNVMSVAGVDIDRNAMLSLWNTLLPYLTTTPFPDMKTGEFRYAFENPSYGYGDGSILHAMIRHFRPKRIIEVGSGWSTACIVDTIERHLDGKVELTCIEPYPELARKLTTGSKMKVQINEQPVQLTPVSTFESLKSGDFLFINSTHVLKTGSDVCFELAEVLPRLASGVIVHFHDIFWPFEYPETWVLDENRSWNELYALRAYLTENSNWKILMFNHYLGRTAVSHTQSTYPKFNRGPGGAFWMQRV